MIGSLRGQLLERFEEADRGEVLVEAAGVGYRLRPPRCGSGT